MSELRTTAEIGVIGGSGLYQFLADAETVMVETPYGPPSDPLVVGEVAGRRVAFVPRHGADHRWPPQRIPYRANLWALRALGVGQVLAPCAVGSLRHDRPIGALVIPDQVVDRTWSRAATFYDGPPAGVVHVAFADPYCPVGREVATKAALAAGWDPFPDGTLVVIEGPRFSSRAESQWYAASGASIIGMTGQPEAALARELALCYTPLALVTDLDAGIEAGTGVTMAEVFAMFSANVGRLRDLLFDVIAALPTERVCPCPATLDGVRTGMTLP
ncbi:MAG TPA: S-methyl-5'-thioadenosine phosphorylase [Sporichthyaceae bacterium]|jgi:5'-methylthioadenosine phosphorylase|nr:S-methyl-5'-thioadenosine phosphorylase [Sporichthyaceae bacterium]